MVDSCLAALGKLIEGWSKGVAFGLVGALNWLIPDHTVAPLFATVGLFVVLDLVTGVGAAWNEEKFQGSKGLRRTVFKVISYGAAMLVCIHLPRNVPWLDAAQAQDFALGGIVGVILLTETVSIFENIRKMGVKLPARLEQELQKHMERGE